MSDMTDVDEILDFAIKNEQDAVDLYTGLAATAKSASIKKAFEQFAGEEAGHRTRLEDVLIFALHHEKAAFRLYSALAAKAVEADLQQLFSELAQEEAKHKLRFEVEYDENILAEN